MPGETRVVKCRFEGVDVACPVFVPSDGLVEHITAPAASYQVDPDGLVYVSVTNSGGCGLEFDTEDALLEVEMIDLHECYTVLDESIVSQLDDDDRAVALSMQALMHEGAHVPSQGGCELPRSSQS